MGETIKGFDDATDLKGDPEGLRARLRQDGYLFFPGLLNPAVVLGVRADVTNALADHGWLRDGSDPIEARPGPEVRNFGDPSWWAGYTAVLGLESFNRLAHSPALVDVASAVLGDDLVVHPMKITRITYPHSEFPTPPHQDFFFIRGTTDVLTSWIPLGDCDRESGGLKVLAGSHHEGLRAVRAAYGAGGISADVDADDPRWVGPIDYKAGDVLIFHSLLVHTAPANKGDRLRISADFRFQSASDPLVAGVLFPHAFAQGTPLWHDLTQGWTTTRWVEVTEPVRLTPVRLDPDAVPSSRLLS